MARRPTKIGSERIAGTVQVYNFVELPAFTDTWDKELQLNDDDLAELQLTIMRRPDAGPVISGVGGLRKLRFAPSSWRQGKRGALRICYAIFPNYGVVLLAAVYAKNNQGNLTTHEKQVIAQLLREYDQQLQRRRKGT